MDSFERWVQWGITIILTVIVLPVARLVFGFHGRLTAVERGLAQHGKDMLDMGERQAKHEARDTELQDKIFGKLDDLVDRINMVHVEVAALNGKTRKQ